ncbi:hydrolase [Pseudomonas sp. KNUC1026]|uniref:hydrolase n=1 Tax=Pseudomonas sp. KNUC1026 TaxID=2893890 RepID=UPI001F479912|nr:hydrolase [Pseudomonas sp. KNUC1026]UFH50106.1 hydrolase [Pseudomonas sp. KNUC1026]
MQGPVLERLSEAELLAVFGHELAHYLLWQQQQRCYLAAERILAHASDSGQGRDSHRESYRRYRLHTELFADRGAAIAAGGTAPAITTLVKMHTGMTSVDAQAYLRQAEEIEARETAASAEASHPETFVRARALALWWAGDEQLDAWLDARLKGPLTLNRLDLPEQVHLQALTRQFIAWYLQGSGLGSDSVLAQVRLLFSDWANDETPLEPQALLDAAVDKSVLGYFNALMVDLALADPDQQDAALLRAGAVAERLGCLPALLANLRRDANFNKRDLDRFKRELAKEARP